MNLRRQLLLISLLTLVLPWAGCQFIRETESALRAGQQQLLAGTARAIADSLAQYPEEFPPSRSPDHLVGDQLYGHPLETQPSIDGYFDDWLLPDESLREMRGADGPVRFALGLHGQALYFFAEVTDRAVVYAAPGTPGVAGSSSFADRVSLVNSSPPYREEAFVFAAEAPGPIVTYLQSAYGFAPEPAVNAWLQDGPRGYRVEARIPLRRVGTHLGVVVANTASAAEPPLRSASFAARAPGALANISPEITRIATGLVQPGMRLVVTDATGWRLAAVGSLARRDAQRPGVGSTWLRIAYDALVESGEEAELSRPDASGREQQGYIVQALQGRESVGWFRSRDSGAAVVAVAQPVVAGGQTLGAVVLQQNTDAILSLRNQGLARLMNVTLIATLVVAATLLGYASWLSRRIRRLSLAAEAALDEDQLRRELPSALARDEVGDLSRGFSSVLRQLGEYNDYLRTLASKLSHELRTPLAIVTSSLENLEHETLTEDAAAYAARAKDGAGRLRRILTAMSEASRVEELMQNTEPEKLDLAGILPPVIAAYRDVYPSRSFTLDAGLALAPALGSPELLVQLLDKLVDNAVDFSADGDTITVSLRDAGAAYELSVQNPGPPLPERMRSQLFDSMVSVRAKDDRHLGLGLYVAKLIAEGHGGSIAAANTDGGVTFSVLIPKGNPGKRQEDN
jgi:dedicated sortase system histidine kinase